MANVVVARLIAEATHRHVLDHAGAQRADGPVGKAGGHREILERKVAGPSMLGIGRPPRHALPLTTSPKAHRRLREPTPARAGSFHAPIRSLPGRLSPSTIRGGEAGKFLWRGYEFLAAY